MPWMAGRAVHADGQGVDAGRDHRLRQVPAAPSQGKHEMLNGSTALLAAVYSIHICMIRSTMILLMGLLTCNLRLPTHAGAEHEPARWRRCRRAARGRHVLGGNSPPSSLSLCPTCIAVDQVARHAASASLSSLAFAALERISGRCEQTFPCHG